MWRYPARASPVRPVANSNTEKRSGRNQMADRIRRTDQPSETQLRLEPHRNHRHHRGPNLVRTRRLRPQPGQDQRPRRLNRAGQSSRTRQLTRSRRSSHHSNPFQVEVANCHAQHPQKLRAILGVTEMYLRLEPYCNAFHFIFRTTSCGLFTQAICCAERTTTRRVICETE